MQLCWETHVACIMYLVSREQLSYTQSVEYALDWTTVKRLSFHSDHLPDMPYLCVRERTYYTLTNFTAYVWEPGDEANWRWETNQLWHFFFSFFVFAAGVWCLLSWAQEHANLAPTASGNWHAVQVHQATSLPFPRRPYRFHFCIHLGDHQRNQHLYSCVDMGSYPQVHSSVDLCSCTCHHGAASRNPYTTGRCSSSYLQTDSCSRQPKWTICKGICWSGLCSADHISIILQQLGVFFLYHVVHLLQYSIVTRDWVHVLHRLVTGFTTTVYSGGVR